MLNEDPLNPEAQRAVRIALCCLALQLMSCLSSRQIGELIQQKNIDENHEMAMEMNPEAFAPGIRAVCLLARSQSLPCNRTKQL